MSEHLWSRWDDEDDYCLNCGAMSTDIPPTCRVPLDSSEPVSEGEERRRRMIEDPRDTPGGTE